MEVRALISRVYEELSDLSKLVEINDAFREYALRWLLYAVHQDLLNVLAMVVAELGLRNLLVMLGWPMCFMSVD